MDAALASVDVLAVSVRERQAEKIPLLIVSGSPWGGFVARLPAQHLFLKQTFERKATSVPICALCTQIVTFDMTYDAAGRSFHRTCLKCSVCQRSLRGISLFEMDNRFEG